MMKHGILVVSLLLACGWVYANETPLRVGIVTDDVSDFWTSFRDAALAQASEQGLTLDFRMPSPATVEQQQELVRQLLDSGVTALAISPIKPEEQRDFLNRVSARTPLATLYTDAPGVERRVFLGRDEEEVGRMITDVIQTLLPRGLKVMAFCDDPEGTQTAARLEGLRTSIKDIFWLEEPQVDFGDRMLAAANMADVLQARPEIACLIGLRDYHGSAMMRAVMEAGRARMVRVVGVGVTPNLLRGVQEGIVHGLVVDDAPAGAALSLNVLEALSKTEADFVIPEDGRVLTPLTVLKTETMLTTQEVLDEFNVQIPGISEATPDRP